MRGLDLSLVLVTHHSSSPLSLAVAGFRRQAADLGLTSEVVVVDHSEDAAEVARVAASTPDHLLVLPNRGYAAGINAGVAVARGATLFLGNPDIVFESGSVAALMAALADGWSVVGPRFEIGGFQLPPAEEQTPLATWRRQRALGSPPAWSRFMRRELERCETAWQSREPLAVPLLSGALLTVRAEAARALGAWDEDYFLYFEEADWLLRASRQGARFALVPSARVVHRWGHAADPATTGAIFEASRRRFFRLHYDVTADARGAVAANSRRANGLPERRSLPAAAGLAELGPEPIRWLVSPSSSGFPFAGASAPVSELHGRLHDLAKECPRLSDLSVVACLPAGRFSGPWRWRRSAGP